MASSDLLILCYHAISDSWPVPGAVPPKTLERQIGRLLRSGYVPLTLSAALVASRGGRRLVVTFDDAFQSVLERGLPVLQRLSVPATLFVPTDFVAEAAPLTWSGLGRWLGTGHEHELSCMSWEGVRRLAGLGWEIGSHTRSHHPLTAIDGGQARAELDGSKLACEAKLQQPCLSLAYPFGRHDREVVELARRSGYEYAVTLGEHLLGARSRKHPLALSREGIYRGTRWPEFLAATSPALGKVRASRLYRGWHPPGQA